MSNLSCITEEKKEENIDIPLLGLSPKILKKAALTQYPNPISKTIHSLSDEEKIAKIEKNLREVLETLGLNLEDDSIAHTSYRIAKMYVKEIFSGLNPENFPSLCFIEDSSVRDSDQMILIKDISMKSTCEHHFVPMIGQCHVAYFPNKKVIGLSKINRIVRFHCQKPQIQERLTAQIVDSIQTILNTDDVAVFVKLKHFCVTMRGVEDEGSSTETTLLKGKFKKDASFRQEFLSKISS